MKVNLEKVLILFVVACLVLTSMVALVRAGTPLTREEAIEISRNSNLVQSLLENADWYRIEVYYQNKTQSGKEHAIWKITWYIHPTGAASLFAYVVGHSIDEETGEILSEGSISLR